MNEITASTASAISQMKLGQEIATRITAKAQDVAKQQGQAALSLLQGAMEMQQESLARSRASGKLDVYG